MADRVYPAALVAGRVTFRALGLRIRVGGDDRIPAHGPAILACTHASYLDFVFAALAARRHRRCVRFLCRADVWDHWLGGPVMRDMRHVPVVREAGAAAYLTARTLLRSGEVVGVFPEGGVSRAYVVRPVMRGAVALARDTGAPLLPVAIWGTQRVWPMGESPRLRRRRPITVLVGERIPVDPAGDLVDQTRRLRAALQAQLDLAQAEHPDQPAPGEYAPWHPVHLGGHAPTLEAAAPLENRPRGAID